MLNKLLFWLTARLPCRQINLDSGPYLERYYLGQLLGVTFYLHRFVSSDSERHLHNHPWGWGGSLILCGSYIEERAIDLCPAAGPAGCLTKRTRRRWYNQVNGNTIHRIHQAEPGTWTLFFHGARVRVSAYGESDAYNSEEKGWGFFESRPGITPDGAEVHRDCFTVFKPYRSGCPEWWKTAPTGEQIGRVPL